MKLFSVIVIVFFQSVTVCGLELLFRSW